MTWILLPHLVKWRVKFLMVIIFQASLTTYQVRHSSSPARLVARPAGAAGPCTAAGGECKVENKKQCWSGARVLMNSSQPSHERGPGARTGCTANTAKPSLNTMRKPRLILISDITASKPFHQPIISGSVVQQCTRGGVCPGVGTGQRWGGEYWERSN